MKINKLISIAFVICVSFISHADEIAPKTRQELSAIRDKILASDPRPCVSKAFEFVRLAIEEGLNMPEPDPDGRIQTLNKKGAMSPDLDPTSKAFIEASAAPGAKALEIGAGYGLACIEALKRGAMDYWTNDLDTLHLKILARRLYELNPYELTKVNLIPGDFLEDVQLPEGYFDVVLIARVLHFMNPEQALTTLRKAYRVLKPGGKLFAVMLSPYVRGFASFIPTYEARVKSGEKYPGWVENLSEIADRSVVPESALKNMDKKPFLFFDTRTARSLFEKAGFKVVKSIETPLAYKSDIWQLDGRENIGVIAEKPGS